MARQWPVDAVIAINIIEGHHSFGGAGAGKRGLEAGIHGVQSSLLAVQASQPMEGDRKAAVPDGLLHGFMVRDVRAVRIFDACESHARE